MIAIVASTPRERAAFAALCESRGWSSTECDSLRTLKQLLRRARPGIVLTRHRLGDGYSDDVIALVANAGLRAVAKVIVLIGADTPSSIEARQVALGADLVQRDPVRTDVLVEYLAKYGGAPKNSRAAGRTAATPSFQFANGAVQPIEHTLRCGAETVHLTPREIALLELLHQSRGKVVTYDVLYSEILGRRFRGDTSNMRVLLGKLTGSFRSVGLEVRGCLEVVAKSGYRYNPPPSP